MTKDDQLLEQIFKSRRICYAMLDKDFKFIRVNEAFAQAHKKPAESFTGMKFFEIGSSGVQEILEDVVSSKKPCEMEAFPDVYPDQADKGTRYWDWGIDPILSQKNEVEALLLTEVEVTERVLGKQASDRTQELMKAIARAQQQEKFFLEPLELFDALVSDVVALTESEYGFIGEVLYKDDSQPYIKLYAIPNFPMSEEIQAFIVANAPPRLEFSNMNTLLGAAVRTGEVTIANNPAGDSRSGGLPKGHPPLKAFLGMPIRVGEKIVATLGLANRPNGYDDSVVEFIQPLLNIYIQLMSTHVIRQEKREAMASLRKSEQRVHRLALPAVEYEHRELVNLINDCYEQMENGADTGTIEQLLNQIYAAVAEHFAHEEELMLSSSYPEYEPHKDSHEQLLLVYRDLIERFVKNPEAGVERAQKVLADWFIRHVSTADQELHNHFPGLH